MKIIYRQKKYLVDELETSYYAFYKNTAIILTTLKRNINTSEEVSSTYHNLKNIKEYNDLNKDILGNKDLMVTKHEYNRLFKEFKTQFTNNCFIQ